MVSAVVLLSPPDSLYRATASMASTASAGAQQAMVQLVPTDSPSTFSRLFCFGGGGTAEATMLTWFLSVVGLFASRQKQH